MPVDYTKYPTAADLSVYLTNTGLAIPSGMDASAKIADAIEEWELRTGWRPFLKTPNPTLRPYDPPAGGDYRLILDSGALAVESVVILTGVNSSPGIALTESFDYFLKPNNAVAIGDCIRRIEFVRPPTGLPQSIQVTAIWGRVEKLPPNVWSKIIEYAAYLCRPELSLSLTGGATSIEDEGSTTVSFVAPPLKAEASQWLTDWEQAITNYTRKRII